MLTGGRLNCPVGLLMDGDVVASPDGLKREKEETASLLEV